MDVIFFRKDREGGSLTETVKHSSSTDIDVPMNDKEPQFPSTKLT